MKFLCLAYGDEEGWNSLTEAEKQEVLAHDEVIRDRGNLMSAVQAKKVTSVRNWNRCAGCRNALGTISFLGDNKPCAVFHCTNDKGITYCYECTDFPCDHLHPYADQATVRPHNTKLFNLCLIKKMGIDQWVKDKALNVKKTYFNGKLSVHAADEKK